MEELEQNQIDEQFMQEAYKEALKAFENEEVPIGAVIVYENKIVGSGYNQIEKLQNATAHAEVLAIEAAAQTQGTWRLNECTLYVTLEPCMMCLGASLQSRIERIVYGATDSRFGAVSTYSYQENAEEAYRRWPEVTEGILKEECKELIQSFFKKIRKKSKEKKKQAD